MNHGVMNIVVMLIVVLGLFTALFFIARSVREDKGFTAATEYIIPTVTNKKLEEAIGIAQLEALKYRLTNISRAI